MNRTILALTFALLAVAAKLHAQDTRNVTQPTIPGNCAGLTAEITATADDLTTTANAHFDTSRIQSALNSCASGHAVELAIGTTYNGVSGTYNAFQIQPITIPAGVTLLIDSGVTVFASINPRDYDESAGSCGIVASSGAGCKPLITIASGSGSGIMGPGVINGRGGDTLQNTSPSTTWWGLSATAQTEGLNQYNPILVVASSANNFTLYETRFENAPIAHVVYNYGTGYTVWGITTNTPWSARNTDSLDIGNSQNVTVTQSTLSGGDDDVAVGSASGQEAENYTISNNHIFGGHGVSVGSITHGGVANILVENNSFYGYTGDNNSTALRIKSAADRGGIVNNVQYENICIQNSSYPLILNPHYNSNSGSEYPDFTNIGYHDVNVLTAGYVEIEGYNATYPATVTLDNVNFVSLPSGDITPAPEYANITLGPGPVSSNLSSHLTGTGVTVNNDMTNNNAPYSCPASAFGTPPIPDGTYVITSVHSGLALSDPGSSTSQGTFMEQQTATNAANQQWTVTNLGNNVITLTNGASGYNMDVYQNVTTNGAFIDQWSANYASNQQWTLVSVGNGVYELVSVRSGLALDVVGGSTSNNASIDQYTYGGNSWQQWTFSAP